MHGFQNTYNVLRTETNKAHSLEKDPNRRASPWRMLEHPWMIEMKSKRVNMGHFLSKVWGWGDK